MPRDILSEFGNDVSHPQAPRATNGGDMPVKLEHYEHPAGPLDMYFERPGLPGGTNCGNGQMPTSGLTSGGPGNHGTNHGNKGSQGSY